MKRTEPTAPTADEPELLTLQQTARSLSISKRTLARLISGGSFPSPVKIGRASRVPRSDIATYLDQLCAERGDKRGAS